MSKIGEVTYLIAYEMHRYPLYALRRSGEQKEEANVRARVGDELHERVLHEHAVAAPRRHHVRKAIDGEHHSETQQLCSLYWKAQYGTTGSRIRGNTFEIKMRIMWINTRKAIKSVTLSRRGR